MTRRYSSIESEDIEAFATYVSEVYDFEIPMTTFQNAQTTIDVADRLWEVMPDHVRKGGKCGSAVAFYRLKAALVKAYPKVDWRPNTRFATVPGFRYARLRQALGDWNLPGVRMSANTFGLAVLLAVTPAASMWPLQNIGLAFLVAAVCFVTGAILVVKVLNGLPVTATPGSMAVFMTGYNIEHMRNSGVTLTRQALRQMFEQYCDLAPTARIV